VLVEECFIILTFCEIHYILFIFLRRYFMDEKALIGHKKTKNHKKRFVFFYSLIQIIIIHALLYSICLEKTLISVYVAYSKNVFWYYQKIIVVI